MMLKEESSTERSERLRDGLRREREIYEVLCAINRRQCGVFTTGRTEEILQLAKNKERELARIEEIETELTPLKAEWRDLRNEVSAPLRHEVEEELRTIEEVLRELIEQENRGQKEIEGMWEITSQNLKKIESGRRVQQAYGSPEKDRPRYLDRTQ